MIPLARRTTTRRLETTLVSYSRQSLPRPARFYSTPSKKASAPALATSSVPHPDYPAYLPQPQHETPDSTAFHSSYEDMQGFLRRRTPYTILPTPLPDDASSPLNDLYFTDSPTQDHVAVIDACLHNLYDVPRAQEIFERLRKEKPGDPILSVRLYNSLLASFLEMASTKEPSRATYWVENAVALYESMEDPKNKVKSTGNTFATMLLAWQRFNTSSESPLSAVIEMPDPKILLRDIVDCNISVTQVVADRAFITSEQAAQSIRDLSKAAVELNMSWIVNELGAADVIGRQVTDPLENVPEARPVLKLKKKEPTVNEDGAVVDNLEEPEYEVPFNLWNLRKHLEQVTMARRVLPDDSSARQKLLEESVYDVAAEKLKHQGKLFEELGISDKGLNSQDLRAWMWSWHVKLQTRIKAEIASLIREEGKLSEAKLHTRLSPFMTLIKHEKLSLIAILEIMHLQSSGGVSEGMKTARALLSVGKAVEMEYKAEMCRKNHIGVPTSGSRSEHGFFTNLGYRDLHARRVTARKYMEDAEEWTADWTQTVRVRVGSFLVDCLMDEATVTRHAIDKKTGDEISEEQPAFFHSYEYVRGKKLGVIKLNPVVSGRIAKDQLRETLHPRHLPMLIKPKPWLSHDQGGYLYNKTSAMRYKDSQEQLSYLKEASTLGNLELVYASLDVLGTTPWRINRDVFDVVLQVWNSGKRLGKLPPADFDEPEPEKPANYDTDPKARNVYLVRQKQYFNDKANNHSDRCNVNYKIEIARTFLGDTIYMPHNLDFRGRAYPIPPHLNHIGDDLSRGLLKFGEARALGETGLRWLKIHCANLYGYDKGTFEERVQFVHDHLEDIYDSADHPLDGRGWWKNADDPWQCLATCKELKAALESGNPTSFMSDLPVHQDGTCNGLQHYAALGGDSRGAQQVNLSVTDKPSDVYTYVAEMVQESMKDDIAKGDKNAMLLDGKIARKVVKQTVMTTVYGVTFIGARDQIERQLKDRGDVPIEEAWFAAAYLAKKVLSCIGDLFSGAKNIQAWLNLSARLISKSIPPDRFEEALHGQMPRPVRRGRTPKGTPQSRLRKEQMTSVIWTTPLGLPIVQPYRQIKRKQIATHVQSVYISDPNSPAAVNTQKQASAFPPNFIHSLDATHMMLTALECRSRGLAFASVHDSYWTHACSVTEMSGIIRDTFIALHSSDVLSKLDEEFRERYKGYKIPLSALRMGRLWNKLGINAAGVKIGKACEIMPKLLAIANTPFDTPTEMADAATAMLIAHGALAENGVSLIRPRTTRPVKKAVERSEALEETEEEGEEENENEEADASVADELESNFVELVDVLPAVPKKGEFDVNTIKSSLYFFS